MSTPHAILGKLNRGGITLLEVLIAMFVLAVGILSIFGLFAAGREMEARAILLQRAMAYADGPGLAQVNNWMNVGQWLHYDGGWRWVHSNTTPDANTFQVLLPLMVDPISLASGTAMDGVSTTSGTNPWDWNRVVKTPFGDSAPVSSALQRITLASTVRPVTPATPTDDVIPPFNQDSVFNNAGDPDDVRYDLDITNPDNPPRNAFALGRRARNADFVPALFLANSSPATQGRIQPVPVRRWLLIHYKPFTEYEQSSAGVEWPAGSVLLDIETTPTIQTHSVITLGLSAAHTPFDSSVVRKVLQPNRWLLFMHELPAGVYEAEWLRISNVTRQSPGKWLVLVENQASINGWISSNTRCLGFESVVHVKEIALAPPSLPWPQKLTSNTQVRIITVCGG